MNGNGFESALDKLDYYSTKAIGSLGGSGGYGRAWRLDLVYFLAIVLFGATPRPHCLGGEPEASAKRHVELREILYQWPAAEIERIVLEDAKEFYFGDLELDTTPALHLLFSARLALGRDTLDFLEKLRGHSDYQYLGGRYSSTIESRLNIIAALNSRPPGCPMEKAIVEMGANYAPFRANSGSEITSFQRLSMGSPAEFIHDFEFADQDGNRAHAIVFGYSEVEIYLLEISEIDPRLANADSPPVFVYHVDWDFSPPVKEVEAKWVIDVEIENSGRHAPMLADGVALLAGGGSEPMVLDAISTETGQHLWRFDFDTGEGRRFKKWMIVEGLAVIHDGNDWHALKLSTGEVAWRHESPISLYQETYKDGLFLIPINGVLTALEIQSGTPAWKFSDVSVGASNIFSGGKAIFTGKLDDRQFAFALDFRAGTEIWRFGLEPEECPHELHGAGDTILLEYSKDEMDSTDFIMALEASNGDKKWFMPIDYAIDTVIHASKRKIVLLDFDGRLRCLDAASGHPLWKSEPEVTVYHSLFSDVNEAVYYCSEKGGDWFVNALTINNGRKLWSASGCSFALVESTVYVLDDKRLLALDAKTGGELWRFTPWKGGVTGTLRAADGKVYFSSFRNSRIFAVDAASGEPLWQFQAAAKEGKLKFSGKITVADGVVYFSVGSRFYAVSP